MQCQGWEVTVEDSVSSQVTEGVITYTGVVWHGEVGPRT